MWLLQLSRDIYAVYVRVNDRLQLLTVCHVKDSCFGLYTGMLDRSGKVTGRES